MTSWLFVGHVEPCFTSTRSEIAAILKSPVHPGKAIDFSSPGSSGQQPMSNVLKNEFFTEQPDCQRSHCCGGTRSGGGVWKRFSRAKSIRVCQAASNGLAHSGGSQLACPLYTAHRELWKEPDTPVNIYCSNQMHNSVPSARGLRALRDLRW